MAKEYKSEEQKPQEKKKPELLSFNVWFSELIMKNDKVKANHMMAIKAHFRSIGITESETAETYEDALKHYGA